MKLGELTAAMPKAKGNQHTKSASSPHNEKAKTKAKGARTDLTLSSQSEYVIGSTEQDTGKKIGKFHPCNVI